MSRLRILVAAAALAYLPSLGLAQAEKPPERVDVTGKWQFTVTSDVGTGTPTVTFKQQGDSITGHYSSQTLGEVDFKGTIKERKLSFSFKVDVQGTSLAVTYAGTVDAADAMKGTVDFGGLGGGSFTAKRQ